MTSVDSELQRMITARIAADGGSHSAAATVVVHEGVVRLCGAVGSEGDRRAFRDAAFMAGATVVCDELNSSATDPGCGIRSQQMGREILCRLDSEPFAGKLVIAVVQDRVVCLGGYLPSSQDRRNIEQQVSKVCGVKDVQNCIHVDLASAVGSAATLNGA